MKGREFYLRYVKQVGRISQAMHHFRKPDPREDIIDGLWMEDITDEVDSAHNELAFDAWEQLGVWFDWVAPYLQPKQFMVYPRYSNREIQSFRRGVKPKRRVVYDYPWF